MASNSTLADKGLVRGTFSAVTIDGYPYLLKTGTRNKPVRSSFEYGETGLPNGGTSHVKDYQKLSGEVLARAGIPDPSQLVPFLYDGTYWTLGNLTLNGSTEGLRSYSCELLALAGTQSSDFVTS